MCQENYIKIEFRGGETGVVSNYYVSTKINYKFITYTSVGYAGEDALSDANSPTVVSQGSASSLSDYVSGMLVCPMLFFC